MDVPHMMKDRKEEPNSRIEIDNLQKPMRGADGADDGVIVSDDCSDRVRNRHADTTAVLEAVATASVQTKKREMHQPVPDAASASSTKNCRKRVRLAAEHVVVGYVDDMTEGERDNSWWRQDECDDTKAVVKSMCRKLRSKRRFSDSLSDAYERACAVPNGEHCRNHDGESKHLSCYSANTLAITESASEDCMAESIASSISGSTGSMDKSSALLETTQSHMLQSKPNLLDLFDDYGPRGLERLSSTQHAFRRQRHLQEVKSAVLMEQARQKESKTLNSELLARHSECATRNSRAFAHWMGVGDAWAAGHQIESTNRGKESAELSSRSRSSRNIARLKKKLKMLPSIHRDCSRT
ncbi:hypothetical protein IV203_037645 [Nitzschia inconspicua]|uniref:Uncharacterized protein n=1 Tax=Nitzschia inconspicua TaxID=303405 RepID=A0A9K3LMJ8_9STRA|nr:hypothetical protein IV203_037645 [Nitzschia inconspicua]